MGNLFDCKSRASYEETIQRLYEYIEKFNTEINKKPPNIYIIREILISINYFKGNFEIEVNIDNGINLSNSRSERFSNEYRNAEIESQNKGNFINYNNPPRRDFQAPNSNQDFLFGKRPPERDIQVSNSNQGFFSTKRPVERGSQSNFARDSTMGNYNNASLKRDFNLGITENNFFNLLEPDVGDFFRAKAPVRYVREMIPIL